MAFEVNEVEPTPNPNAIKFVLDRPVAEQPVSFFNADAAVDHPLAHKLFKINGVASLLLLGDFITVNKEPDAKWPAIVKSVRQTLTED